MILWDKTEQKHKVNENTAKTKDWIVVSCDVCGKESNRKFCSYKQTIKRINKYLCHDCATKNKEFRQGCAKRAKEKWVDQEYIKNNLAVVKSDAYREEHRRISESRWQDEEYRSKMITPEKIELRRKQSSELFKELWQNPEYRAKISVLSSKRMKEKWNDEEYKQHMASIQQFNTKKMWEKNRDKLMETFSSDKFKDKMKIINREISNRPDVKEKLSAASLKLREDPTYRQKMFDIQHSEEYVINQSRKGRDRSNERYGKNREDRKQRFISNASVTHNGKYDYSKIDYVNSHNKIKIVCPEHGPFYQMPDNHWHKSTRCPGCAKTCSKVISNIKEYIGYLYDGDIFINDRTMIKPYELDMYLPDLHFAIEFDGLFWHSYDRLEIPVERNKIRNKIDLCDKANVRLFNIREDEWLYKQDIIKSMILNRLGLSCKIYARNCEICDLSDDRYKEFIEKSHLQGYRSASIICGLTYNGEIVAVMSFNSCKTYKYEIIRYACKPYYAIVGGASKLFKHFIKTHDPLSILTYADRRHSNGSLYYKLGFKLESVTLPGYIYVMGRKSYSRQMFQKHKLQKILENYDPELTEAQNMFNHGFRRMWDGGNYKFIWKKF